jgi:hypothetical protein
MSRGEQKKIVTLRLCNPYVGFSQAPEHVEGGVDGMREEKVGPHRSGDP